MTENTNDVIKSLSQLFVKKGRSKTSANFTDVMTMVRSNLKTYANEINKLLTETNDVELVKKYFGTVPGLGTTFRHLGEGLGKKLEKSISKTIESAEVVKAEVPVQ